MTPSSRTKTTGRSRKKLQAKKPINKDNLLLSVTRQEGKTTIRQLNGRRFVRLGEVRGKVVAHVELFTSQGDSHSLTIRFKDQTALYLLISPGFTINAKYYKNQGLADPRVLKRWPEIRSE
jgi:hypothetical protein